MTAPLARFSNSLFVELELVELRCLSIEFGVILAVNILAVCPREELLIKQYVNKKSMINRIRNRRRPSLIG
ncbi:hypothetical protein CEXT_725281 [Caerostris extrusa]|uniref:Uncharacterized protein n=1 Tax=Caerostris extrusa TaxID=172846 RepID=A0AAV4NN80_CAEEX|nr:hypothetical protein CEXT_725281 [Caerostris extrusa]